MAVKKKRPNFALSFVTWFTGIVVSLAVGNALIEGILYVRWLPSSFTILTQFVGWILVITTIISAALAIIDFYQK